MKRAQLPCDGGTQATPPPVTRQYGESASALAERRLDGLLAKQIQSKRQAQQILALVAHHQRAET